MKFEDQWDKVFNQQWCGVVDGDIASGSQKALTD